MTHLEEINILGFKFDSFTLSGYIIAIGAFFFSVANLTGLKPAMDETFIYALLLMIVALQFFTWHEVAMLKKGN